MPYAKKKLKSILNTGSLTARASSLIGINYAPHFAIDDKISEQHSLFFHSQSEDYPWLEITMPEEDYVGGVEIVARWGCCADRLKNIEIRAGMTRVPDGFKGQMLEINTEVGEFPGPASNGQTITINFENIVLAKYITLQNMGRGVNLELNEVRILKGKDFYPFNLY